MRVYGKTDIRCRSCCLRTCCRNLTNEIHFILRTIEKREWKEMAILNEWFFLHNQTKNNREWKGYKTMAVSICGKKRNIIQWRRCIMMEAPLLSQHYQIWVDACRYNQVNTCFLNCAFFSSRIDLHGQKKRRWVEVLTIGDLLLACSISR